ncbi:hypothetical protein FXO37_22748 [Capsicum annuum]|nr:hypothetical protein FXO37_22748 [Capsicum annuum]
MSVHMTVISSRHWRHHWRLVSRSNHSPGVGRSRQPKHESGSQPEQPHTDTHRKEGDNFHESQACAALVTNSNATPLFPAHPVFNTHHWLGFCQLNFQRIFCSPAEAKNVWREIFSTSQEIQQGSIVEKEFLTTCLAGSFTIWAESAEATEDWAVETQD